MPKKKTDVEAAAGPFARGASLVRVVDWGALTRALTARLRKSIREAQRGGKLLSADGASVTVSDGRVAGTPYKPGDLWVTVETPAEPLPGFDSERTSMQRKVEKADRASKAAEGALNTARTENESLKIQLETARADADRHASRCADLEAEIRLLREAVR